MVFGVLKHFSGETERGKEELNCPDFCFLSEPSVLEEKFVKNVVRESNREERDILPASEKNDSHRDELSA